MCATDFDYYLEPQGEQPWDGTLGPCGGCHRRPVGELVEVWTGLEAPDDCWVCDGTGDYYVVDDYGTETETRNGWCPCCVNGVTGIRHRVIRCLLCTAAAAVLDEWCDGMYAVDDIPEQITEHWHEDSYYQSYPFARLVVLARHGWRHPTLDRTPGPLATLDRIEALATGSLTAVKQGAPA